MIVYKVVNKIDGKVYIGQTIRPLDERVEAHRKTTMYGDSKNYFHNALRKYGIDNFIVEEICTCVNQDTLNACEELYIEKFNSMWPAGYNLKHGGANGKFGEEAKMIMSNAHKNIPLSEKHRESISKGLFGNTNTLGRKYTDKQKTECSERITGSGNPFYGKKHSEESKRKISEKQKLG